ncbi:hypothetical protein OIU85_022525, partial [Salix viminalis]
MLGNQPRCNKCGRFHSGECPRIEDLLYLSQARAHSLKAVPKYRSEGPGRVHCGCIMMTQEEADPGRTSAVICGNVSLLGLVTYVLIDYGATHSFISKNIGRKP